MDSANDTADMAVWTLPGYRHERELGSGATGRVMLARHEATGTPVAIKYLVRDLHSAPDFRTAYRSEAVLLGGLDSPHVARLYEYVESEHGAAIVMEPVEGVALRELLRAEGATTPEAALVVLKGSLLGLAAAHETGVVHRDYKPENVLVTPQGVSKLVDFGIAARSGDTGAAAGTPVYMAPEQFSGEPARPSADVYAATATFFECVTGDRPYSGTTVLELMIQHTQAPIPDELAPERVRPLVRSGLAKSPQERPASAAAFVEALEDLARAGFGEDWEERGQRKLATLVAMLPLLLLGGPPGVPSASTDLATTDLGPGSAPKGENQATKSARGSRPRRHRLRGRAAKAVISMVVAGAVVGSLAAVAAASHGGGGAGPGTMAAGYGATSGATTSVAPTPEGGPGPAGSNSATPAADVHGPSSSASAPAGAPSSSPSADAAQTSQPSTAATSPAAVSSSPPPPPPVLHVRSVSINKYGCSGNHGASAIVDVTSDGAATGTLYLSWYYTDANGAQHSIGTDAITIPKGRTDFVNSTAYFKSFGTQGVYWGLSVSTKPAAARGNGSTATVLAASCEIS
ncbi:MAG TPA: serine/threonine-protein kinase [Actinocrinis sp.]|nr:serine/threonine-protein kinase [Actinocrinis sp.]